MAVATTSHKPWSELSKPEKVSRWLAHQRYVRNAEQRHSGTHWLETINAARFEGYDNTDHPKWTYRLKYVGWGPRWNRWEDEEALQVDDPQIGRPQIVTAFWNSLSKQDRQRIPQMKVKDIILPGQGFIEERQSVLQHILQLPEYQEYCDEQGHAESETGMSDLEVDEPQLFAMVKKATTKQQKRYVERMPTRKAQSTAKVKRLRLLIQQPVTQASFHPSVFQSDSLSLSSSNLHHLSSASELVQSERRQVSMFQVDIPERGYYITPSQNPKRRTIFEEPQYTDNAGFPMVNRTSELIRKSLVVPMWSELPLRDGLTRHDQELPTRMEEPMGVVDSEMAEVFSYLNDDPNDLFDDMHFEMDLNEDSTNDPSISVPPGITAPAHIVLGPNQVEVSALNATGGVVSIALNLLDLAICDDVEDLIESIRQRPDLGLEGPYNDSELDLDGWQMQDAVVGVEVLDGRWVQDALLRVGGPKFYRLYSGSDATGFILFDPAHPPAWLMVPEEAQECHLALWKL